ncbi:GH1 family beta-glucosidase [Defluviitalea phaphyphila]|uniref:GH1 family beta-glucosidase n=1 Tax=Defluviitalea phaphyphila TaxID=1473580 RepID=UPI000730A586|nr:GH1 family beta-glucosidase [Defluviitalea phaphyphila]
MFKKDFVWGVATASYQIEGGAYEDGKGLSIWDMFCKEPGRVYDGNTGDFACDSYHRIDEDVKLLKELGVKAYRFSISWPRVLPNGIGEINEKGLEYYEKLVDALIEAGIEPYITLFHWDYPYELYKRGQWLNPKSSNWFEEYVTVVLKRLGSKVRYWMTLNEPQCFIGLGYYTGEHAPGHRYSVYDIIQMIHNTLLAHGKAVRAIRKYGRKDAKVGFAFVNYVNIPNTFSEADIEAAKEMMFNGYLSSEKNPNHNFIFDNDYWYDPILLGKYPNWLIEDFREYLPKEEQLKKDLEIISTDIDFIGLNIYQGVRVEKAKKGIKISKLKEGHAVTGFNWKVSPEALYWGPKFTYERYKKPIYITENGLSNKDWVALDGKIYDQARIDFLQRYLLELKKAYDEGIPVEGYFHWSFLDNFEWAEGYKERFGLVYVDFETGERIPKESYYWYKKVCKENKF